MRHAIGVAHLFKNINVQKINFINTKHKEYLKFKKYDKFKIYSSNGDSNIAIMV